ncbi:MAG: phage major capsid protein [Betaproteobacteria bacterium]|nr:phage major capsid protein [Betaproteobacteria bacterium]
MSDKNINIMSRDELAAHRTALLSEMSGIKNRAEARLGRINAAARKPTADEEAAIQAAYDEFEQLDAELAQVNAGLAREDAPPRKVAPSKPMTPDGGRWDGSPGNGSAPAGGPLFNAMFPQARGQASREFSDLADFARAVYERNPRLFSNASGMGEGVGADGGFYVPTHFFAGLMDDSLQQEAIRPRATIIPMASSTTVIPMFNLANRSTGIATLEGKMVAEGATADTQKAALREVTLSAKKISVLVPTTTELLQDSPQVFVSMLQQAMTEALAQTLDTWFIGGNGVGCPLGILNAPALVSVAKDGSQVNATLTPTNISGMVARLAPGSWSRAVWLVSPSALAQLFGLTTVVKNVAANENVGGFGPQWFQTLPGGEFSLLGRPVVVTDRCQALGTKGDIMLCDLKNYLVGLRQKAELLVDSSIGFKESEIWFRLNCRVDGQPALASAITPRVGSATLSPFVTLDAR